MQADNQVLLKSELPWIAFAPPAIILGTGVFLLTQSPDAGWLGWLLSGAGGLWLLRTVATALTHKVSLTSKRLTARTGLFSVSTVDLPLSSVEGIETKRNPLGLVLGYGTLLVRGSGGSKRPIYLVKAPKSFKDQAMQILAGDLTTARGGASGRCAQSGETVSNKEKGSSSEMSGLAT